MTSYLRYYHGVTEMSFTKTILAVGFFFFTVTLFLPLFPPASLMHKYVSIPQTTLSIGEISVTTLLDGTINGLFWILFTAIVYGLVQLAIPARMPGPLDPMPFAPYLSMPPLENRMVDSNQNIIPPCFTVPPSKRSRSKGKKQSRRLTTKSVLVRVPKTRIQPKTRHRNAH